MGRTGAGEDGFTVVEGLVAALLLVLAATAIFAAFSGARRATYRAEQTQVASDIAQRELESLRQIPYDKLGMYPTPTRSSDPANPANRVIGARFDLNGNGSGDADEDMVTTSSNGAACSSTTCSVAPTSTFTQGDVSGTIYRFVVWRDDSKCKTPAGADLLCPGLHDYKRIVVAVGLNATGAGGAPRYVELQSDAINPTDSVGSNVNLPLLGTPTVAQQFWLGDERCQASGEPDHSTLGPLGSHALRNTLGTPSGSAIADCASTNANRPDAMLTEPAPTYTDGTVHNNGNLDFSTDLTSPYPKSGLQYLVPSSGTCTLMYSPPIANGNANNYKYQHVWVSKRLNTTGAFVLTGGATLKLWTRALNDAAVSGSICVVVFRRTETEQAGTVTAFADNVLATQTLSMPSWPRGGWEELTVPLNIGQLTIPAIGSTGALLHQRLGVAIGLMPASSDQLQFEYDSIEYESRLEVETTTPIG